jgi:hypothetical protein
MTGFHDEVTTLLGDPEVIGIGATVFDHIDL